MIRIEKSVREKPETVLDEAASRFGPEGLGLTISEKQETCVELTGGGGFISVTACENDNRTQVELTSREWDEQAKAFMAGLR